MFCAFEPDPTNCHHFELENKLVLQNFPRFWSLVQSCQVEHCTNVPIFLTASDLVPGMSSTSCGFPEGRRMSNVPVSWEALPETKQGFYHEVHGMIFSSAWQLPPVKRPQANWLLSHPLV